jgi:hypothetical protein
LKQPRWSWSCDDFDDNPSAKPKPGWTLEGLTDNGWRTGPTFLTRRECEATGKKYGGLLIDALLGTFSSHVRIKKILNTGLSAPPMKRVSVALGLLATLALPAYADKYCEQTENISMMKRGESFASSGIV